MRARFVSTSRQTVRDGIDCFRNDLTELTGSPPRRDDTPQAPEFVLLPDVFILGMSSTPKKKAKDERLGALVSQLSALKLPMKNTAVASSALAR